MAEPSDTTSIVFASAVRELTQRQERLVETAGSSIGANITDSTLEGYEADRMLRPLVPARRLVVAAGGAGDDPALHHRPGHRRLRHDHDRRRLAAICWWHETNGLMTSTRHIKVKEAIRGIRHTRPRRPIKRGALTAAQITDMVTTCDRATNRGRRETAPMLVGYTSASRRSELAAVTVEDVARHGDEGFVVWLDRTKDDKDATKACEIGVPALGGALCPVETPNNYVRVGRVLDDNSTRSLGLEEPDTPEDPTNG